MALILDSKAFDAGNPIPDEFTCDGEDVSPPLSWKGAPSETESFTLICDDPDAPNGTFSHWVLYNLSAETDELPRDFASSDESSNNGMRGRNDFGDVGYGGPCPPAGSPHRYYFRLYALDRRLDLSPGATRDQVLDRIQPHILEQTELVGTYSRS